MSDFPNKYKVFKNPKRRVARPEEFFMAKIDISGKLQLS
jgi:hypothetical protein